MNLPRKLAFLIFSLLVAAGVLQARIVRAQIPPGDVPCDEVRPDLLHPFADEFHSLRPYQANPCDEEVPETAALFCGNSLVISDTVSVTQTTPPESDEDCVPIGNDRYRCTYTIEDNKRTIAIDLSSAELPIMGNTELVINSQEQPDPEELDNAEKVNEYVSWYLNGIINRAEYPFLDPTDEEDISKIVDFSGPLKKLLPWEEQARQRIKTIERAVGKDINKDGQTEDQDRHDQIFACTFGIPIKLFGIWEVARAVQIPVPCYDKGFLSFFADFFDLKDEKRLSEWKNHLPPLAEDYEDFQDYWVEYKRWRGESCAVAEVPRFIPVVGGKKFIYCFDNPAKSNYWANLFPYIPFSSTEDRVGLVELDSFGVQPVSEGVTITNVSIEDWNPAELYFAHMQEASELAEILQQTFVPKDGETAGGTTGVSPGGACDLVNVRTNEGDDLFAGEIGGTLSYDAEFSCDFDRSATESVCTKEAIVNLSVLTKTPKADDVWERTVAGPSAIFKRIFPKVGPGGAILGILDIPAATKVTYTGADFAGNPGNQRSGEGAELYFPHIGGVSEYFLKGIQTILRPKGYGEQILSGQPPSGSLKSLKEMCEIADFYNLPCEFLDAIWLIETSRSETGKPCGGEGACGPMAIMGDVYRAVTTTAERSPSSPEYLDRGTLPDAFEIAARILIFKKYIEYNLAKLEIYRLNLDEIEIVGRYHGTNNCLPTNETQCRWGTGYSYCDAVESYLAGREWPSSTPAEKELYCPK